VYGFGLAVRQLTRRARLAVTSRLLHSPAPQSGDMWIGRMQLVHDDGRPLSIELLRVGRRVVVVVGGEIDVASVDELNAAMREAEAWQPLELWIDLTDVEFMDSTGLTALLLAHRSRREALALICPDGSVRRLLELAGVDRIVPVHANRAAAQAAS